MFDQHDVISVFYSVKGIMSFNKFYFRDFGRHLFQRYFRSNIAISKTSFLGAPSQDRARQTDCLTVLCSQEARFGSTCDCVPEETHAEETAW